MLSKEFIRPVTTVSSKRLSVAMMLRYKPKIRGENWTRGGRDMQLHEYRAQLSAIRAFAAPMRCPHCGDIMVAPVSSEFVEGGEIRHHWECEACGEPSSTSIPLTTH